jgi:hypothetical protein
VPVGEGLCQLGLAPGRRHDVLQVIRKEIGRGLPVGRVEELFSNSDPLLPLPVRVDRGTNLPEAILALAFLLQNLGEFRWWAGHLNHRDAILVGGPAFMQAARAERLPTPAGAQVIVTEKSWSVH